jgi:hypothetical protein
MRSRQEKRRRYLEPRHAEGFRPRRARLGSDPETRGQVHVFLSSAEPIDESIVRESTQHLRARLADGEVTLHLDHLVVIQESSAERNQSSGIGVVP